MAEPFPCDDCQQPTSVLDDYGDPVCVSCQDERDIRRAERAQERAVARAQDGDAPLTLDERHAQAWRQKREGR